MHMAAMIDGHRAMLDSQLAAYRAGQSIQEVLPYYRRQLPGIEQFTIMLEQVEEVITYVQVFPPTSVTTYKLAVWGVGQVEDDQHRDDSTAVLAAGLKAFLNSRHAATEIEPGKWLYFKEPPVQRVSYGVPNFGDTKTGAFMLTVMANCDVLDRDPRTVGQLGNGLPSVNP